MCNNYSEQRKLIVSLGEARKKARIPSGSYSGEAAGPTGRENEVVPPGDRIATSIDGVTPQ